MMISAGTVVAASKDHGGTSRTFVPGGCRGVVTKGGGWPLQVRWEGLACAQPAYRDEII
jgi:hypothetical protein